MPTLIFLKQFRKSFQIIENYIKWKLEGDWKELGLKICCLRQAQTKYVEKKRNVVKSDRTRTF